MNTFKKAKQIQRKHPRMSWQDAIQAAGKQIRKSTHQTGTSNKKRDQARKSKKPGKRRAASGKIYYERRKDRTDKPGSLTGVTAATLTAELRGRLKERLGVYLLAKDQAGKKMEKRRYQKLITEIRKKLNKLS